MFGRRHLGAKLRKQLPLTSMFQLVPLQLRHLEEPLAAYVTRVCALIAVHTHVVLVMGESSKALQYKENFKLVKLNKLAHYCPIAGFGSLLR